MNLAVKFYRDEADNPDALPDEWPSQVMELGDSVELPSEQWTLMTKEEYEAYRTVKVAIHDDWVALVHTKAKADQETFKTETYAEFEVWFSGKQVGDQIVWPE